MAIEAELSGMRFSPDNSYTASYIIPGTEQFTIDTSLGSRYFLSIRPKTGYAFGETMIHFAADPTISRFKYKTHFTDTTFSDIDTAAIITWRPQQNRYQPYARRWLVFTWRLCH